jgi:16S rRNA (cytosine967-C5)-methyltransferase
MSRVSPARAAAYSILRRVESGRGYAVDLFQRPETSALREDDRRLATELVMGVLRWRGELDFQIEKLAGKRAKAFDPEVATILRLGAYQILFLTKIPKAAAVNEAVELVKRARKRSAAGLVNAVLRRCERASFAEEVGRSGAASQEALAAAMRALPEWLRERWTRHFGAEAAKALAWASVQVPPISLRAESAPREALAQELAREGVRTRLGKVAPAALIVESGSVQGLKALVEGRAVIQDEASQLVASLVAPRPGDRVLDLCAAPGIKTRQLAGMLGQGTLVACDLSAARLRTMVRLLAGHLPAGVSLNVVRCDASQSLPFGPAFERVLLDVPCSGTGTLARNPEIKLRLQPADLSRLAEIQKQMLAKALAALAPGGRLVYSTCSLEPEENEGVVAEALRDARGFRKLSQPELAAEFPHIAPLFDERGCFRTRPDLHRMDGFFAAVITRGD